MAEVTDTARMRMFYGDKVVVDLTRAFIDSAGAKHYSKATICLLYTSPQGLHGGRA